MKSLTTFISENKSLLVNGISLSFLGLGYIAPKPSGDILVSVGLFSFSGAVTNWFAVYMLFEKVPFLYGSGVIPARFEDFKNGIHSLIMTQFFTPENVERFFHEAADTNSFDKINFSSVVDKVDFSPLFDSLTEAVLESPMGSMLNMFGGKSVLEGLRESCLVKIKKGVAEITATDSFKKILNTEMMLTTESSDTIAHVDNIVKSRLEEMTPKMVKEIIQDMIRKHLGWLVVWGGVFGGIIGFAAYFVK